MCARPSGLARFGFKGVPDYGRVVQVSLIKKSEKEKKKKTFWFNHIR